MILEQEVALQLVQEDLVTSDEWPDQCPLVNGVRYHECGLEELDMPTLAGGLGND